MNARYHWLAQMFAARSDSYPRCEHGLGVYGPYCHVCGPELMRRTKADLARMHPL
jgi:hypothetical protein